MKKIYSLVLFSLLFIGCVHAQNIDKITAKCPSPNQRVYGTVQVIGGANGNGNITLTPCPTGTVNIAGVSVLSGSGTVNRIPVWTGTSALGDTGASWSGTRYRWRDTAQTSTFDMSLVPSLAGAGNFTVGGLTNFLSIDEPTFTTNITASNNTGVINITGGATTGGVNINASSGAASQTISMNNTFGLNHIYIGNSNTGVTGIDISTLDAASAIALNASVSIDVGNSNNAALNLRGATTAFNYTTVAMNRTVTAGGTTGAQTINKAMGSVNFAAGASTLVVTDSVANATSLIFLTPQAADATCLSFAVTRAAGSFTITSNAACTAETAVAFWVTN